MDELVFPTVEYEPVMKGLLIGGLGILHVFLAQFAIGGGMLMCYFQWLSQTHRNALAKSFVDGYFRILVLISFVVGAVTGVGMWFTTIQISPRTIGLMVDEFHWIWAIEWTFFCLEVAAGYAFYRFGRRLPDRTRLTLLVVYSIAAWFSLFWINGILSWQLTPGAWADSGSVWVGFFNPGFFPSLIFRTITCMAIASLVACVIINAMPELDRGDRKQLINRAAHFLGPMLLMPFTAFWYFSVAPQDSRAWALGGSPAMTLFLALAVGASVLIGGYAAFGMIRQKLLINGATATLLTALAFGATAGGEFVREGIRKPYTIRGVLYSNSLSPDDVKQLRRDGCLSIDPWPVINQEEFPNEQLIAGFQVYRIQCSICHTVHGANGLSHLTESWSLSQKRMNIAQLQYTKPYMPPFAGTAEELEAIVQWISWQNAKRPGNWEISDDPDVFAQNAIWIGEAPPGP